MRFWICLSVMLMNNLFAVEQSQQLIGDNSRAAQPGLQQTAPQLHKNDQSAAANRLVKSVIERNRILFGPARKR